MSLAPPGTPAPNEVVSDETFHFDYPGSDIILRSCDSHNFRIPKVYITNSSPVLRELIRSVSNTADVPNGEGQEPALPVVELPESGATLHSLLTFIYPVTPILSSTTEEIMGLLAVAQKYQMGTVLAHIRCTVSRRDPPFICPESALHLYFLAQQHGLHQEALQAARVTLRHSMALEDLGDKLEFPGMTGAYLHELWKYHERVRSDLESGVLEFRNSGLPLADNETGLRCTTPRSFGRSYPRWLDDYLKSIAEAPHLFDLIEFESARARHIEDDIEANRYSSGYAACSCLGISSQAIRAFWEALTVVVHRTIAKVLHNKLADSTLALVKDSEEPTSSEYSDPPPSSVPWRLNVLVPDANIILRSSDQADFRVHKSVLAMSSPFFEDMLSLPQPPGDDELVDNLPVVQLSEDADLLNSLVSLLYPVPTVIPGSYERVFALLAACQKYDMESIQSYIRAEIERGGAFPAPVGAEAFHAYAVASNMGLVPEMENAARLTLGYPMTFEFLGEGLQSFKGRALCDLVRYRKRCRDSDNLESC